MTDQDLLLGAKAVASFIGITERQVHHLAATNAVPTFRINNRVAASKRSLSAWIEKKAAEAEARASQVSHG